MFWVSLAHVTSRQAGSRGDLSIGVPAEPDTLNPILFTTQIASQVGRLLFDGLLRYDENLNLA